MGLHLPNHHRKDGRGSWLAFLIRNAADLFILPRQASPHLLCRLQKAPGCFGMCLVFYSQRGFPICVLVSITTDNWNNWKKELKIRMSQGRSSPKKSNLDCALGLSKCFLWATQEPIPLLCYVLCTGEEDEAQGREWPVLVGTGMQAQSSFP